MNRINDQKQNKKKKSNPLAFIIALILIIAQIADTAKADGAGVIIAFIVIIAVIACFIPLIIRKMKSGSSANSGLDKLRENAAGYRNAATAARERANARSASPEIGRSRTGVRLNAAPEEHSHDRAAGYEDFSCTPDEHWKKQLDGFLANGIIDRAEYRFLMKKRSGEAYYR